ncbi:hypothetical protein Tco_0467519 [Tanacetum coccineum]
MEHLQKMKKRHFSQRVSQSPLFSVIEEEVEEDFVVEPDEANYAEEEEEQDAFLFMAKTETEIRHRSRHIMLLLTVIIVSRNVVFDEPSSWKWEENAQSSRSDFKIDVEEVTTEAATQNTPENSSIGSTNTTPTNSSSGSDLETSSEDSMSITLSIGYAEASDDETRHKENQKRDAKALFFIQQVVDESIFLKNCSSNFSQTSMVTPKNRVSRIFKGHLQKMKKRHFSKRVSQSPLFSVIEEEVEEDFVVEVEVEPIPYTAPFVTSMATPKSFVGPSLMKQIMQRRRKNKTLSCSWLRQKPRSLEVTFLYIDSGCSHHITGDKSKFSSLDESVRSHVRLGDDKQLQIEGQGTAKIYTGDHKRFIKDVHFAPCLAHNLLSVGQLMETGHSIFFNDVPQRSHGAKNSTQYLVQPPEANYIAHNFSLCSSSLAMRGIISVIYSNMVLVVDIPNLLVISFSYPHTSVIPLGNPSELGFCTLKGPPRSVLFLLRPRNKVPNQLRISSKHIDKEKALASSDRFPLAILAIGYLLPLDTFFGEYLFGGTPRFALGGNTYLPDVFFFVGKFSLHFQMFIWLYVNGPF